MKIASGWILAITLFLVVPHSSFAIIAGTPVLSSDAIAASTAAFLQDVTTNAEYPTGIEQDACSGTLLSDSVLVTAGHCIMESPIGKKILFSTNIYVGSVPFRIIDQFEVNPNFKEGYANGSGAVPKNNSDIALLHFTGGLPAGYRKAEFLPTSYQITGQEKVILAGYGISSTPKVDAGNVVIDPYAWLGDGVLRQTNVQIFDPGYASSEIELKESATSYSGSGDSGGPAFFVINCQPFFIGVDNWGDVTHDGIHFEVYADMRSHLSWMDSVMSGWSI